MPWTPADAKKKYKKFTKKQSEVWSSVANASLANGDEESVAIKKANAAINNMRKHEAYSEAAVNIVEIGRSISVATGKQIKAALKSMQDAMAVIAPLITSDDDAESDEVTAKESETISLALQEAGKILAQIDSYDSKRYAIQAALRKRAITNEITSKVSDGAYIGYDDYYYGCSPYIRDLYDDYVIYTIDGFLYQCTYTITDDSIELGDEILVRISYVPDESTTTTTETQKLILRGDLIQLSEKAVRDDGTARVKLISPGWGSSGYYGESMLKRDGPKIFTKGLHMYMNHPTEAEDRDRPERDLRDLAGILSSEVVWEAQTTSNSGPGLYGDVNVFSTYRNLIDDAAPYIGTSIRAAGTAIEGEAEGRHGLLIDELVEGYSVDYVTYPGRGGQILPLYESARQHVTDVGKIKLELEEVIPNSIQELSTGEVVESVTKKDKVVVDISQEELDALKASAEKATTLETQMGVLTESNKKITNALIMSEARNIASETIATIEMPVPVRAKLLKEVLRTVPMKEGDLDRELLIERIKESAADELKYIESVTGTVTGGKVTGMSQPVTTELVAEEVDKELKDVLTEYYGDSKTAELAASGRFN